jgi:serine phosphatase RsbU (regulator of sigma subunit)
MELRNRKTPPANRGGKERLETLLRACRDCAPAQIVERILDEVLAFGKDCSQKDDMTLVAAAVKSEV